MARFELLGIPFVPVPLFHGEMEVLGFRFGRAAYLTDFSNVPDSSMSLLEDLDNWSWTLSVMFRIPCTKLLSKRSPSSSN